MDHRTRVKPSKELKNFEEYIGEKLPTKRIVCPTCRGEGRHVNPSIDENGITGAEMAELGPEFQEDYMSGVYDVLCYECKGLRVVDILDEDWLVNNDRELLKEWNEWLRSEQDYQAICDMERRMGA